MSFDSLQSISLDDSYYHHSSLEYCLAEFFCGSRYSSFVAIFAGTEPVWAYQIRKESNVLLAVYSVMVQLSRGWSILCLCSNIRILWSLCHGDAPKIWQATPTDWKVQPLHTFLTCSDGVYQLHSLMFVKACYWETYFFLGIHAPVEGTGEKKTQIRFILQPSYRWALSYKT